MVSQDPFALARDLARALHGQAFPLGHSHGLARIVGHGPQGEPWAVDLARMRGPDIEADLACRDFTIDAMALPLSQSQWGDSPQRGDAPAPNAIIDPLGGQGDLRQRAIRMASPSAFADDPARLLRAVSLAARLDFTIEPATSAMMRQHAHAIASVSGERIREEFCAILAANRAKTHLTLLDQLGLLCAIIPELEEARGVEQPREHYWDVFQHSLEAVEGIERVTSRQAPPLVPWGEEEEGYFAQEAGDNLSRHVLLKLACLLHDIAKPRTKTIDDTGRTRFFGHHTMGAEMTLDIMRRLRFSSANTHAVCAMVRNHLRPGQMSRDAHLPTPRAIHRFFRDLDGVAVDTLYLSFADYLAARGPALDPSDWHRYATRVTHILRQGTQPPVSTHSPPLVNGHHLMEALQLPPGPCVGWLLQQLHEAEATGQLASRQEAIDHAAWLLRDWPGHGSPTATPAESAQG